jgi:hypothetical protein
MKKTFCDICEAPAEEGVFDDCAVTNHAEAAFPGAGCEVTLRPIFAFRNHPCGFSGPPDLCDDCRLMLIEKLKLAALGKIRPEVPDELNERLEREAQAGENYIRGIAKINDMIAAGEPRSDAE